MKQNTFQILLLLLTACLLPSCEKMNMEEDNAQGANGEKQNVVIRITDINAGWDGATSRTQVHISEVCSRLQFAVYQNGTRVKYDNQIVGDDDFGTFALKLEAGSYQLLALGHSGTGNVTTTKPEKLQFTNTGTGFSDTFYYYGNMTVSSDGALVDISMERATSMFRLKTADVKPAEAKKFEFYYTGGSGALDATTGLGCVNSKQSVFVSLDDTQTGQPLTFEMYTFLHQESGAVSFTVTAFDEDDGILYTKVFKNVPMKRNCITQYTGNFFTDDEVGEPEGPSIPPSEDSSSNVVYVDPEWADVFEFTF